MIGDIVLSASLLAEAECDRKLKKRTYSATGDEAAFVISGRSGFGIRLPQYPIVSVSKVEFLIADTPELWEEQALATYVPVIDQEHDDHVLFRSLTIPRGIQNVRVSCVAGIDPIPGNLKQAMKEIVLGIFKQQDKQLAGVQSRTGPGGDTVVYTVEDIPKQAKTLLRPFARWAM